jgi:hypothetical protein
MERIDTMKRPIIAIAAFALVLSAGCNKQNGTATTAGSTTTTTAATTDSTAAATSGPTLTPEQLGQLGAKIKAHPKDSQKILGDAGLTEASFEAQIRKVSSDVDASKRYAAAYKQSS